MRDDTLPITDWSEVGRREYVDINRQAIELIIEQALEDFDEINISITFGNQTNAVVNIIDLFLLSHFSVEKLPTAIPKDITLFSQLSFWIKYKTAGKVSGSSKQSVVEPNNEQSMHIEAGMDSQVQKLARNLRKLNHHIAPDLIGYWLDANKKLLKELSGTGDFPRDFEIENDVSDPQKSRYKADASFRYLYFFLNIVEHIDNVELYEKKYFVKGLNRPQYVAAQSETHHAKYQVRLTIKQIINRFHAIYAETPDHDVLTRALFKGIAKKALLDVYEINKNEPNYADFTQKLKQLKAKPSALLEQVL
ncbi:hypothetical protein NQT74_06465 [Alteromonas stellipolaris]|uniref:hypothetical protein n=1 Tax=Alteromonas stellipolaris TaxID=233316 RepID=UPI0021193AF3|nr:hypothetical protein [Alteromonas stellipolaris]MCQ8848216.1 hypothetical protein [Alteromonas stellipolaris]